jgi:hypothetical protein
VYSLSSCAQLSELGREAENGRLMRLLIKLGFVNERPEGDVVSGAQGWIDKVGSLELTVCGCDRSVSHILDQGDAAYACYAKYWLCWFLHRGSSFSCSYSLVESQLVRLCTSSSAARDETCGCMRLSPCRTAAGQRQGTATCSSCSGTLCSTRWEELGTVCEMLVGVMTQLEHDQIWYLGCGPVQACLGTAENGLYWHSSSLAGVHA